jgi:hypothetical protein
MSHNIAVWGIHEDDRFLATTPLAHPAGVARLIAREGITVAGLPAHGDSHDAAPSCATTPQASARYAG